MSAVVGTVLKKIAVALLADKNARKKIVTIILVIVATILSPIVMILSVFDTAKNIDWSSKEVQQSVIEHLSEEEKQKLNLIDKTLKKIEKTAEKKGCSSKVRQMQEVYLLAMTDQTSDIDFAEKLVGCFFVAQNEEEVVRNINRTFSKSIKIEDFERVMSRIKNTGINTNGYVDVSTKNNLDLVKWAENALENKWGYVWGTYGLVLDEKLFEYKLVQYPEEITPYKDFIEQNWLGGRCADCVGLIKGYGWFNPKTSEIEYATNGMPDIGADTMFQKAEEKGAIDTMPDIKGLAVWHKGHIGVYIGNGEVIEAMGTKYGVVKTKLKKRNWTHWLKIPYITYLGEKEGE